MYEVPNEVIDAARRLVAASKEIPRCSTQAALLEAVCERDMALHDLIVAIGEQCDCEPGTCPDAPAEDVDVAGEVL